MIVPPFTPFTEDMKVDWALLEKGVDAMMERSRPELVVAAGVEMQEYQYLRYEERLELISKTLDAVDGRAAVAVGVSHPSYKVAIDLAHYAEKLGAQAIQLLAPLRPNGNAPTIAELVRYFELVGRETSLPIVLYLNAGPGADPTIPETVELAKLDYICAVKESSRDLARASRLITEIDHAGLAGYYTTMQLLLITLQLGGSGITLPSPASEIARYVIDAYKAGDLQHAIELQQVFATWPSRWMSYGLAEVMKASSEYLGVNAGVRHLPYESIKGESLKQLHQFLETNFKTQKEFVNA